MNDYPEFKNPYGCLEYGKLSNTIKKFLSMELTNAQGVLVRRLIRYTKLVHARVQLVHRLDCVRTRTNVTYREYSKLCNKYYRQMQAEILEGRAYKFMSNLGIVLINYLKATSVINGFKPVIDWTKTQANKKALEENNIPIYKREVYKRYVAENIADKYTGVRYMVYETPEFHFQIVWSRCSVKNFTNYRYSDSSTPGGNSRKDDILPHYNIRDIVHLERSIHSKLYAILRINPTYYNLFVRNRECHVYKYRRNYRSSYKRL